MEDSAMKIRNLTMITALALPTAAMAQANNEQLLQELRDLKARVGELEKKLQDTQTRLPPAGATWGMTPDQAAELNRVVVKTDAIEENTEMLGFKGLKISGYIEPAYIYNKRQNRAGFQFLNQQSDGYFYDTSYLGSAVLDLTKEMDGGTLWRLTLSPNRGVGALIDGASIVQEASVSVPLDSLQTRLIAGQIPDWSGYEYQQPILNPFTTHNLLYDFTLPTGYTGVGFSHEVGKWLSKAMIANVNAPIHGSNDKSAALVYRVDYSKGEFDGFGFAGLHGKAPNFNTGTNTTAHLFELDGYYLRGDWALQGQLSLGTQKEGAITPDANGNYRRSRWVGVSGLAGYMFTPRLQGLVRADYIRNDKNGGGLFTYNGYSFIDETSGDLVFGNDGRNGIGPELDGDLDRGANRYALTFGMKYAFNPSTTLKVEYRFDGADRAVFEDVKSGAFKKNNHLLGTSLVVAF
jgi:tetrahydromethanopterin S-methyltransferase subunit B